MPWKALPLPQGLSTCSHHVPTCVDGSLPYSLETSPHLPVGSTFLMSLPAWLALSSLSKSVSFSSSLIFHPCTRPFMLAAAVFISRSFSLLDYQAPIFSIVYFPAHVPRGLSGKEYTRQAGDARYVGSIPEWGRSPGEGNGKTFQYSCLGNPVDRGAWQPTDHWVAKESNTTWLLNKNKYNISSKLHLIGILLVIAFSIIHKAVIVKVFFNIPIFWTLYFFQSYY